MISQTASHEVLPVRVIPKLFDDPSQKAAELSVFNGRLAGRKGEKNRIRGRRPQLV
jgi:hypothetical protein